MHKEIQISYVIKNEKSQKSVQEFTDLLKNGPKISLKNDHITREWIHERDNDEYLYR